jgi:hypothetical protein
MSMPPYPKMRLTATQKPKRHDDKNLAFVMRAVIDLA